MARENGQLRICDRCGKTIFLKTTGECEQDGGFTRWNKFEEAHGWTTKYEVGDLCPECSQLFDSMKEEFLKNLNTVEN